MSKAKVARRFFVDMLENILLMIPVFLFLLVWFSIWNSVCSLLLFSAIRHAIEEPECCNYAKVVCMLFVPHVIVGLLMPLFLIPICGPLALAFYWPYFWQAYTLHRDYDSLRPATLPTDSGPAPVNMDVFF